MHRSNRQPFVGGEDDVLAFDGAEALHLDPQGVARRLDGGEHEGAGRSGDRGARAPVCSSVSVTVAPGIT